MKRVLVIIVTYNGMRWLERCLGSVQDADVFVVDNDSADGSADWIQGHFPQVKLIRSAENLGFTAANNLGFRWAMDRGYDYVYLLNQDAWLAPGALETLVSAADANPEYAVLSPLQYQDGYQQLDDQFSKILRSAQNDIRSAQNDIRSAQNDSCHPEAEGRRICAVGHIMAAHWLVRVAALRKIGPFGELFPYYGQDDDWCHRARYHGFKIGVVPEARAVHDRALRQESLERVIDRNYRVGSLVRLCDINRPLWERFLFVCLFTAVKAVKYGSLLPFKHFGRLCRMLPQVRAHRRAARLPH